MMQHQNILVCTCAALLFLYLYLRPEMTPASFAVIACMWAASMAWDLHVTFLYRSYVPRYERSFILRFMHARLSQGYAMLLAMCVESAAVVLVPFAILFGMDLGSSAAVAYLFTVLHMCAVSSNMEFVKSHKQ